MPLGARLWHYAAELRTLSVTYPLCGSALTDTTDNPFEMCPLKLTDFLLVFVPLITHNLTRAAYSPPWLSQVFLTGVQTGYPQMGEPTLYPRSHSDLLAIRS